MLILAFFKTTHLFEHQIKLREKTKGNDLRKHSLREKIAAPVLLKLFISGYERCHTTDAPPSAWAVLYFQMLTSYNP